MPDSPSTTSRTNDPQPSRTGNDDEAPTDPAAAQAASGFMQDLSSGLYTQAWSRLCDAGKKKYPDGIALRHGLDLDSKKIDEYAIGAVTSETYNGDPRKVIDVDFIYSTGVRDSLKISTTEEHGKATICGF
jgi:hypothetical protein